MFSNFVQKLDFLDANWVFLVQVAILISRAILTLATMIFEFNVLFSVKLVRLHIISQSAISDTFFEI